MNLIIQLVVVTTAGRKLIECILAVVSSLFSLGFASYMPIADTLFV